MNEICKLVCVICDTLCQEGNFSRVTIKSFESIKKYSERWKTLGKYHDTYQRIASNLYSESESFYYHRKCYQTFCHKRNLENCERNHRNISTVSINSLKRRNNSANCEETSSVVQVKRQKFNDKLCVFCQDPENEETFGVTSQEMGKKFLQIKLKSKSERTRARLALLEKDLDAFAQNMRYHRNCLRVEGRNLHNESSDDTKSMEFAVEKTICDLELVYMIRRILIQSNDSKGCRFTDMNTVQKSYVTLLDQKGVRRIPNYNYKPHIKNVLKSHIPNLEFSKRGPKSELLCLTNTKDLILEEHHEVDDIETDLRHLMKAAVSIRREISESKEWKFCGSFSDFQTPPKLQQLLLWITFGIQKNLDEERTTHAVQTSKLLAQHVINCFKSTRQVTHKSIYRSSFHKHRNTPLSVGTALMLYQKNRSKMDLELFSGLHFTTSYDFMQRLITNVAKSLIREASENSNGILVPHFLKRGIRPIFAADNIDFGSDYGSFHGADLMVAQKREDNAPILRKQFRISINNDEKYLSQNINVNYEQYSKPSNPVIAHSSPVIFGDICSTNYDQNLTNTWLICASALLSTNELSEKVGQGPPSPDTEAPESEYVNMNRDSSSESSKNSKTRSEVELNQESLSFQKTPKTSFQTWAAFHSQVKEPCNESQIGVVAPLYNRSPTEWSVLRTILKHAQKINFLVAGVDCRPIITFDGDLYDRAVKMCDYKNNWIIRLGSLHTIIASLKCLGKYIEGSGLDLAWEVAGVYGPAVVRQILEGRHVYRGLEAHMITLLSVYSLFLQNSFPSEEIKDILRISKKLRDSFDSKQVSHSTKSEIYEAVKELEDLNILKKISDQFCQGNGVRKFLQNYITQVLNLLSFISATRSGNWKLHLESLEKMCVYFHAHDQQNYGRWVPLYLADMRELETEDPESWRFLNEGNFVVTKSKVPFTSMDPDHAIEQEHKKMKIRGGVVGITRNQTALDKFFLIAPVLSSLIEDFKEISGVGDRKTTSFHHESFGGKGCKIVDCALKVATSISKEGNPFSKSDLHNLMTFAMPSDDIANSICRRDELGKAAFEKFVQERLVNKTVKYWESQKRNGLKFFKDSGRAVRTQVKGDLVNLKQERNLISRLLVAANARPDLVAKDAIGVYEFHVFPPSNFYPDGSMYMLSSKHEFLSCLTTLPSVDMTQYPKEQDNFDRSVLIVDAMCIVQSLQTSKDITSALQFSNKFVKIISKMALPYDEIRILFDDYKENSFKSRTREKRVGKNIAIHYHVNDNTKIQNIKQFLQHVNTKSELTKYLSEKLLEYYENSPKTCIVSACSTISSNRHGLAMCSIEEMKNGKHDLEEADQQIILHATDVSMADSRARLNVYSVDTDVLVLLIGFYKQIPTFTTLTRSNQEIISIRENYWKLGEKRAKSLIGWYIFKGSDNTGCFATKGLKSNFKAFISSDDEILKAFTFLGSEEKLTNYIYTQMERYVCLLYRTTGSKHETLKELRWHMFAKSGKEGRQLPPTLGTLIPHTKRAHFHAMVLKMSDVTIPKLPAATTYGWLVTEKDLQPQQCTLPPAPEALLALRKCTCSKGCKARTCGCRKNNFSCTDLCGCEYNCCNRNDTMLEMDDPIFNIKVM